MEGTSKDVVFSEKIRGIKSSPAKEVEQITSEELSIIETNREDKQMDV